MTELILLLQADLDIQAAFERYEVFRLGEVKYFCGSWTPRFSFCGNTLRWPPFMLGRYRRMLIGDFPFGIFYQVQRTRLVVSAVVDLRGAPDAIRRKLSDVEGA